MTDVVTLRSGFEFRNSLWSNSRRSYNAGIGLRNIKDVYEVIEFFEARRGKLHGFRWKDWSDCSSGAPTDAITNTDQEIGVGDGTETVFQLSKVYSASSNPYTRVIKKPVVGTVKVSVNGISQTGGGDDYTLDPETGLITFDSPVTNGHPVTAGFEFDVPVRFDQDEIMVNVELFNAGHVPDISIVEVRL